MHMSVADLCWHYWVNFPPWLMMHSHQLHYRDHAFILYGKDCLTGCWRHVLACQLSHKSHKHNFLLMLSVCFTHAVYVMSELGCPFGPKHILLNCHVFFISATDLLLAWNPVCLGLVEGVIGKIQLHTGKWKYSCQYFHLCALNWLTRSSSAFIFLTNKARCEGGCYEEECADG